MGARRDTPRRIGHRPIAQPLGRNVHLDALRSAWRNRNAREVGERAHRERRARGWRFRRAEIDLHHFIGKPRTNVTNRAFHVEPAIGSAPHRQARVVEACVREPEAEWEQRFDPVAIEPSVTQVDALVVTRLAGDASRRTLGVRRIVRESVFEPAGPRERQTARGARFAGEQIRRGPSALIARVPHLEDRADLREPRHRDGLSGVEHHDGVRIDGGDFRDQAILLARQSKSRTVAAPRKHDGHFGSARRFDGLGECAPFHFRRDPGETRLYCIAAAVRIHLDRDRVRTRVEVYEPAQVVETVGGGHDVVAVGEDDIAVSAPPGHSADQLSVDAELASGAEKLQIDVVVAVNRHDECAGPAAPAARRQCAPCTAREVDIRIASGLRRACVAEQLC